MRKSKKVMALLSMLLLIIVAIPLYSAYATRAVTVTVDGQQVFFAGQQPIIVNDRVLVPVRGVFELMGFDVTWNPSSRIARLEKDDMIIVIPADLYSFVANNSVVIPDVPQQLINDRLLLPLRAVAEAIGGTAEWDSHNRIAGISSPSTTSRPPPPRLPIWEQFFIEEGEGVIGYADTMQWYYSIFGFRFINIHGGFIDFVGANAFISGHFNS